MKLETKKIVLSSLAVIVIAAFTAVGVKLFAKRVKEVGGVNTSEASSVLSSQPSVSSEPRVSSSTPAVSAVPSSSAVSSSAPRTSSQPPAKPNTNTLSNPVPATLEGFSAAPEGYFNDALFIGDSRTVGIKEYGKIPGADFFATVGLSIFRIKKDTTDINGLKNAGIDQVLAAKQYGKIYIMLGINEIGSSFETLRNKYSAFIEELKVKQPNAKIYIEANLLVSATCKNRNSKRISDYNKELSTLADNKKVFYLDVNPLFDDGTGNLAAQYTSDGIHIYARYYPIWVEWLSKNVIL